MNEKMIELIILHTENPDVKTGLEIALDVMKNIGYYNEDDWDKMTEEEQVEQIAGYIVNYNLNPENYTTEFCPYCEGEQVIFSKGITKCPECGKPLVPCSVCKECTSDCPYGCDGTENDEHLKPTNRSITKDEIEAMRKKLYKH